MVDIKHLQDTFKYGYDQYLPSRIKAQRIEDLFHNKQYTQDQLNAIREVGQSPETFNVIRLFTRQLLGYYSQVINTTKAVPKQHQDIAVAELMSDIISYVDRTNNFSEMGDAIKRDGFISGLFCIYTDVENILDYEGYPKVDNFGRPLYKIVKEHIPSYQLVLDPMSTKSDYSDARFIHRFKWIPSEVVTKLFGEGVIDRLNAYHNHLNIEEGEFEFRFEDRFQGRYKNFDNYLVVHSVTEDEKGNMWSTYWSGDEILDSKKVTYKDVKYPYRVVKLQDTNTAEYYGIFEDIEHPQNAINQAILQIQLGVNSNKVMVQDGAVDDISEFTKAYSRVNSVIPVNFIDGVRDISSRNDIQQQYIIIDRAFDRIQRMLGINDSFLGNAFASDSGRKVKLQQGSTIMALRYIDTKLTLFYKLNGWDTLNLIKQYFKANQLLRIADEDKGDRWVELNKPLINPISQRPIYDEILDPASGEPMKDEYGNTLVVPLNVPYTDLEFSDLDIEIQTVSYNDEDEKNQVLTETILNGAVGQMLMSVNPKGYAQVASMNIRTMKTRYANDIAKILDETAQMLTPQPQMQDTLGSAGGASSQVGGQPNTQTTTDSLSQGALQ